MIGILNTYYLLFFLKTNDHIDYLVLRFILTKIAKNLQNDTIFLRMLTSVKQQNDQNNVVDLPSYFL